MAMRLSLGPVFVYEWLTASRRWQGYALRSLFVAALLVNLTVVWLAEVKGRPNISYRDLAVVGRAFYIAIVGTQLALVMLAAPAATAGAICLDKSRGTLAHLLITDLSNGEIVLGKLVARLIPAVGLVVCGLPVMALSTLLGGVNPADLGAAFLVTLATAVLGCALALALSVWASKVHEVLLACLTAGVFWLLAFPVWKTLSMMGGAGPPPFWIEKSNAFWLALGPTFQPGAVTLENVFWYAGGCLLLALVLTVVAVAQVRRVAIAQVTRPTGTSRRALARPWTRWLPGPSLDGNPVLWREWQRQRPSRWIRVVWGLYAAAAALASIYAISIVTFSNGPWFTDPTLAALLNGFVVSAGFLLASVSACTSLAEERARGSIDVLMATPLCTRQIIWGKWWGTFRAVPMIAVLPTLVAVAINRTEHSLFNPSPLLVTLYILALGASLTSLGLALATWVRRLSRAMALSVAYYVLLTVGWVFLVVVLFPNDNFFGPGLAMASPFFGVTFASLAGTNTPGPFHGLEGVGWCISWTIVHFLIASLLLAATLHSFDRCLGRISNRSASGERPCPVKLKPKPAHDLAAALDL